MMKVTAKPTWEWSGKNTRTTSGSGRASGSRPSSVDLKQFILPRSIDLSLSFALKYRR